MCDPREVASETGKQSDDNKQPEETKMSTQSIFSLHYIQEDESDSEIQPVTQHSQGMFTSLIFI